MSSAPPPEDDFSFLPTVDDADVLDRGELQARLQARQQPAVPVDEPSAADEPPVVEAQAAASEPPPKATRFRLKVKPTPRPVASPEPGPVAPAEPEPGPVVVAQVPLAEPAPEPPVVSKPSPPAESEATFIAKSEPTPEKPKAPAADAAKTTKIEDKPAKLEKPEEHHILRPPGAEEHHKEDEPVLTPKEKLLAYWIAIGGRSLALSVGVHLVIIIVAALVVFSNVSEKHIDFLPGGGTQQAAEAEKSLSETVRMRRTPWVRKNPMQRVASSSTASQIVLPEPDLNSIALPDVSRKMAMTGFGSAGAGGGFGSGIGLGGKSGVTFQPIMMFGKDLKAKRLAVILDVSSSMADYLTDVVKEVDRVAKGSPVICYFGCGLMPPQGGKHVDDKVDLCKNPSFERFWRLWYGPAPFNATPEEIKKIKFDPKDRIPFNEVYQVLARRPGTYFVDYNGIVYSWTALVNDLVRNADALYWFSDFMDDVDEKEIKIVLENLKRRRQRLFIQPSIHGASFEQVRKGLVIPTGGDVVEPAAAK